MSSKNIPPVDFAVERRITIDLTDGLEPVSFLVGEATKTRAEVVKMILDSAQKRSESKQQPKT